jgi:tetratricopeptide (TPR) repeat protein
MNNKAFRGFCVLALLALIIPGLAWDAAAAAKKAVAKKTAVEEKKAAAPVATMERKPPTLAAPVKLDEKWGKENQQVMDLFKDNKYDEALKTSLATFDYLKESKLLDGPEAATTYNNLGMIYLMQGRFADSQQNLLKALDIRIRIYGDSSLEVATVWQNISDLYKLQSQYIVQLHQKKAEDLKMADEAKKAADPMKTEKPIKIE